MAGGVRRHQRIVAGVVRLLAAEHLDREDHRLAVGRAALVAVDLHHLGRIDLVAEQRVVHRAVEPHVLGHDVLGQHEVTLLRVVDDVAFLVFLLERLALLVHLAGGRPVPGHLGGRSAAGERRDVAGLAGDLAGVVVELGLLDRVRAIAVAGDATRRVGVVLLAAHALAAFVLDGRREAAARHVVAGGGMAGAAGEVETGDVHVHVELAVGRGHRAVEVAVLHGIAAAAVEVADAAGVAAALADLLRDLGEIDRVDELAGAGRQLHAFGYRVSGQAGRLAVDAGGVVAHQAVDVHLGFEIEARILPAVTDVAAGAGRQVRPGRRCRSCSPWSSCRPSAA